MIDVTSKAFQSLTVSCARCHDHKFDPIPTTDYYSLLGIMEGTRFSPVPASLSTEKELQIQNIQTNKEIIRKQLADIWLSHLQGAQLLANTTTIQSAYNTDTGQQIIGDFRGSTLGSWKSDGPAFGKRTTLGDPVVDLKNNSLVALKPGMASSRLLGNNLFGVLRSPNIVLDKEKLLVRALGSNATIRIIIDNFQLISDPIYGGIEKKVNAKDWQDYVFDVAQWKGHKAYIEILPGVFNLHVYTLPKNAFVDVQYALAYNGTPTTPPLPAALSASDIRSLVNNWQLGNSTAADISRLNTILKKASPVKNVGDLLCERGVGVWWGVCGGCGGW